MEKTALPSRDERRQAPVRGAHGGRGRSNGVRGKGGAVSLYNPDPCKANPVKTRDIPGWDCRLSRCAVR